MKITAVTCVKNEGPFILEWVAHGQAIGVTDFLFYSNDCDDGTDALLDGLDAAGVVVHLPNPAKGRKFQIEALAHARKQDIVQGADWIWNADVDEFLNIHAGNGTIPDLVAACGDPDAISITHQYFANAGVTEYRDLPVIEQFRHSHNPDIWCDRFEIEVKTLLRPGFPASYFGVHRPYLARNLKPEDYPSWTDGSGRKVPQRFLVNAGEGRRFGYTARGARNLATINHYALRSLESYLVKSDRGDANRDFRFFDDGYWRDRNDDAHLDESIQKYLPEVKKRISAMKRKKNIAALHDQCVEKHRDKIAKLMKNKDFQALRDKLEAAPRTPPAELAVIEDLNNGLPAS